MFLLLNMLFYMFIICSLIKEYVAENNTYNNNYIIKNYLLHKEDISLLVISNIRKRYNSLQSSIDHS